MSDGRAQRQRVLVVDDDDGIRESVAAVLEDHGYRVTQARDGAAALAALRSDGAHGLILLDVMMPVMDGRQFRKEQLADAALADIPVVVLTADGSARQKAAAMNAAHGLTKPIRLHDLLEVVSRLCRPD